MITPALRYESVYAQQPAPSSHLTHITAEIATRLEELEELKLCASSDLVTMLADVFRISPCMYRVAIALMHGRTEVVAYSVNALAHRRGVTKQAIHTEYRTQLRMLAVQMPQLARVIESIRKSGVAIEQPQSHADALRQAVAVTHEF